MMAFAVGFGGVTVCFEGLGRVERGISHRPLSVLRPSMITWSFFIILTLKREKMAMQLSSHSWPKDIKEPVLILSNTMTSWALCDSWLDSFIRALYLGEMVSPLATDTCGVDVGSTFVHAGSAASCRQCSVAAESTSATGICLVVSTEMVDNEWFKGLSTVFSAQHH